MTLEMFLTILIVLIIAIIFLKVLRKVLSLVICIIILYFLYFNFCTWEGAVKFATFVETLNMDAYRIEMKETYHDDKRNEYQIDPTISNDDEDVTIEYLKCKKYGPIKICENKD